MIHKQLISACVLMLLVLAGCDSGIVNVRALPTPEPEQPPANLPVQLHQRNWTGSLGQGSCVHASLVNHLRWLNRFELGERWRTTYADGEWDSRLRDRLDAAGIDYSYTLKADPRFLDWASATTRANNGWRATVGTLKDASIEFTVLNKEGDSAFGLLQGLWSSGDPCDVGISDAGGTLTLTCEVMNFNVNQNLEEVISADVTLKPTQSSSGGGMNVGPGLAGP
jgi:hypothetical protein